MTAPPYIPDYLDRGFAPLPIPRRQKNPTLPRWPDYRADPADLSAFAGTNVGLLLGGPSGGLVDVDLDTPEAVAAAPHLLPATGMVSGRAGARRSHHWYKCPDAPKKASTSFDDPTIPTDDPQRRRLVELRSTGGQTVVPPSVHTSGEDVVWHDFGDPAEVAADDILKAVTEVAVVALLARHWPGRGARQDAHLALAGGLARVGWPAGRAEALIRVLAVATGDDQVEERVRTVGRSGDKVAAGEDCTGWPKLAELLGARGPEIVAAVRGWLDRVAPRVTFGGKSGVDAPTGPAPWPAPVPLRACPAVPPFPVEHLPPWMGEWAVAQAAELQVPLALPAVLALGVAAGGVARKVVVTPWPGWEWEPVNLYAMCPLSTGERKSAGFRKALAPVRLLEKRVREAAVPAVAAAESEHRVATKRMDSLETQVSKCTDPDQKAALLVELAAARDDLPRCKVPAAPVWVVDDDTPEMLGAELCRQGGRLMTASAEAKALENIVRDDKANVDIFLKGHAGDDHNTGRITRGREEADRVALTCVYTPQPSVLGSLAERPELRQRGFLGRWLYALPDSTVGYRDCSRPAPPVPEPVRAGYAAAVTRLWESQPPADDEPIVLTMGPDAVALLTAFMSWVEPQMRPAGPLAGTAGWANKLVGLAARLAGVLHCADRAGRGEPPGGTIGGQVAGRAVAIARDFAVPHALAAFDLMGTSEAVVGARVVMRWVEHRDDPLAPFTKRDLHRAHQARFESVDDLQPVLDLLVRHDLIRPAAAVERGGPGRKASPCYEVNPAAFMPPDPPDRNDRNDGIPPGPPPPPDSVHSVNTVRGGPAANGPDFGGDRPAETNHAPVPPAESPPAPTGLTSPGHTLVADEVGLVVIEAAVRASGCVGLDIETTGLDPRADRLCLLGLATAAGVFLVDCTRVDPVPLWPALAAAEVAGHNLAFDLPFLARLGFAPGRLFDTMLASQVLEAGDRAAKHSLKDVAKRHLNLDVDKTEQRADWSGPLTQAMLAYAAADARLPLELRDAMRPKLEAAGLAGVVDLENAALPAVAWAAGAGVGFDRPAWEELAAESASDAKRLRGRLDDLLPGGPDLFGTAPRNWDSNPQVQAAFAAAGVTLDSTDDDALAAVDHPLADALRDYRGAGKLSSTYGTAWLKHAGAGGRVYCRWRQCGTMSGRMSAADPNLQQLPRDARYRKCFAAPPGRVLVKADYSQIELRLAARIADDKAMQDAYARGDDLHALTAEKVLGRAEVTRADRQTAKAVNFGLLFGAGAKRLAAYAKSSYGVAMTVGEAEDYRRAFFRAYPGLKRWHNTAGASGDRPADTRTVLGRRRAGVTSFTEKLNSPVQGSAADGLKHALALLWDRRAECPSAVPVLFVHDEVVVEVDEGDADAATAWLTRAMTDGMAPYCDPVPVEVEATTARTWGG